MYILRIYFKDAYWRRTLSAHFKDAHLERTIEDALFTNNMYAHWVRIWRTHC